MPHTKPKTHEEYWHLCPKSLTGGLASALIHLRARLEGLPVTTQFTNPIIQPLVCPPQNAFICLMDEYRTDVEADEYPFSEFALKNRDAGRVIYYAGLTDLVDQLHLSHHPAARDLACTESVSRLTNQTILLSRLYTQLGHDDFAAYVGHRLFSQPHYGYRILEDEEALRTLFEADELIFHPDQEGLC